METDNAHVNVLNRGDLSSLTWLQSPVIMTTDLNNPNLDTCVVHYASLNFRDIMLGRIIFIYLNIYIVSIYLLLLSFSYWKIESRSNTR